MTQSVNSLRHLAIIMDGNGRWAQKKGHQRTYGHVRGARVAKNIINECAKMKLETLTLYAFSTENWFRPVEEVSFLMQLLRKYLARERSQLNEANIRFSIIGDLSKLPHPVTREIIKTIDTTKDNTGMNLVFALNYGSRQEITSAVQAIAEQVSTGQLNKDDITQDLISSFLATRRLSDPDLIIRTSGESRLSNFLLWQAAYSEIYITPTLWPDFDREALHQALGRFLKTERRFGRTSHQISAAPLNSPSPQ